MQKGLIIVISAPSGTGKTSITNELISTSTSVVPSVSATTRKPRKGEINGKDYFFVTEKEFLKKRKNKEFVEWANVHENYYGTPKKFLEDNVENGISVILDIDVKGAMAVKKKYSDCVLIFILPPSKRDLEIRLRKRKTDDEKTIQKRLINAEKEVNFVNEYDYVVRNINIDEAVKDIKTIISAEMHKVNRINIKDIF